jgi:2-haloacid dehalogenase
MLQANIQHAGLTGLFEQVLSTDQARTYKPDPRAYQLGTDVMKLARQEILFIAFAGWDSAGAANVVCRDFKVNQAIEGRVPPQRHVLSGALRLRASIT